MGRHILMVFASTLVLLAAVMADISEKARSFTRFSCLNRAPGYYADVDTGCQVYHMCDGLGRQFSYKCPNMTLFQQRMLICDHWYMVNCSMSERDYDANLLIGQRDKPFVSDDEMRLRTPRPDILSAPPYNPYYDVLKESETKYPHSGNSIVGSVDTLPGDDDYDLDVDKQTYRPPTSWSTGTKRRNKAKASTKVNKQDIDKYDYLDEAASQEPDASFRPTASSSVFFQRTQNVTPPSIELVPPAAPTTEPTSKSSTKETSDDNVFQFIKRFDPTSPDVQETAMTKSEILNINDHLPVGPATSEEDRTPRKHKNFGNKINTFQTHNDKSFTEETKFNSVNTKSNKADTVTSPKIKNIPEPEKVLLPPKNNTATFASTTVGPPVYYEWKWAVPAFGLSPPKFDNSTNSTTQNKQQINSKLPEPKSPFSSVTRPEPKTTTPEPSNVEYNISSYFIPDYVFPLDKEHPGYEGDEAETSFQVKLAKPGTRSFGENPKCPHCHPAYLTPGSCEPCIVKR